METDGKIENGVLSGNTAAETAGYIPGEKKCGTAVNPEPSGIHSGSCPIRKDLRANDTK